jgi:cell filamentation protein
MPKEPHISRYRTGAGIEGEYEPGSKCRVLRNLLGVRSKRQMDQIEYERLLAMKEKYLGIVGPETSLSVELIRAMHRDWLQSVYVWAGEYRTVEMSKGRFHWPPARLVAQNMATIEQQTLLRVTPCRLKDLGEVAEAAARVQAEVLLVHPFREGNGRLARWLSDIMAMQAGLPAPRYGFTGRGSVRRRRAYLAAVVAGYRMDYRPLAGILREGFALAEAADGRDGRR